MEPGMKNCWRCASADDGRRAVKPIEEFCRGGKDNVCRVCRCELNAIWAKENRDKLRPKRADYMRLYRSRKKTLAALGASGKPNDPSDPTNGGSTPLA